MNDDQQVKVSPQTQITPVRKIQHHYLEEWQNVVFFTWNCQYNYKLLTYSMNVILKYYIDQFFSYHFG